MASIYEIVASWGIAPKGSQEIKNNVWKIMSDEGNYALKRSTLSGHKLDFIGKAQWTLTQNGFQGFSHPLYAENKAYCEKDHALYTLYEWIEGERCAFDNLSHLAAASTTLAQFHLYSRSLSFGEQKVKSSDYLSWHHKIQSRIEDLKRFHAMAAKGERSFFAKMYLGFYAPFFNKALESQYLLLTSAYQRIAKEEMAVGSFIHYDVAARNFVIQRGNAYLIDFDYCSLDMTLVDLMRLMKRSLKYGENAAAKIDTIVSAYTEVKPLTMEHWRVIYALLLFPQKYWRLATRYFQEEKHWSEETFGKKMREATGELERESLWLPLLRERVGLL